MEVVSNVRVLVVSSLNLLKEELVTGFFPSREVLPWQCAYILCSLLLLFGINLDDKKGQLRNLTLIMKTSQVNVIIRENCFNCHLY